jgi:PTS system mannose-specific IID component
VVRAEDAPPAPLPVSAAAALAIALCYYLSQSAWLAGLGFWTLYRPLIGGTLTGIILGDPVAGARAGATINLAYLGFLATGGTLPSDISLAGYLGAALVVAGGVDERAALSLTIPAGMLGYLIYQARMTLDVALVHWADERARRGDARGVAWCNVVPPQALLLVLSVVPCFLGVYWGPAWLGQALGTLPPWLLGSLEVAGGLLPALGIAMSLALLWHEGNGATFVASFVVNALAAVPVLAWGVLAAAVAALQLRLTRESVGAAAEPASEAASSSSTPLRRGDLWRAWLNWLFFSHACYNYERMQGSGFAHAMVPVLRRLYPQREHLAAALQRHLVYYNAEPNLGAVVIGVTAALEEAHAQGAPVEASAINATKTSLMGPLSGLGDSLIQGTLAPALLALGAGLALQGNLAGPLLYALAMAALIWGLSATLFWRGYRQGRAGIVALVQRGGLQRLLRAGEIVGASMLGALAAGAVRLRTPLVLAIGAAGWRVQEDFLDKLFPQALPLAVVLLYLALLRRRVAPLWLMLVTLGVAAVLRGVGWL